MGGQACVFYGAAEFSRDIDLAILAEARNLVRLRNALAELDADLIAVPPFGLEFLRKGHALHFRCQHPEAMRLRIDVMSTMRGVEGFEKLWKRRSTVKMPNGPKCDLLSLPDLVQAKKTQRDKDWPMIRRLVEAHYFEHREKPSPAGVRFWFLELRSPTLLLELARRFPKACRRFISRRPLLEYASKSHAAKLESAIAEEEKRVREEDHAYWIPLRRELEKLRHSR